jgi:hypothetical protein
MPDDGNHNDGHSSRGQNAEALHCEYGRDKCAAVVFVAVLAHNGGAQRVIAAYTESQYEAKAAQRPNDRRPVACRAEGHAASQRSENHYGQRKAVHFLAAEPVAAEAEEELAEKRADQRQRRHCSVLANRQLSWFRAWCQVLVVDATEQPREDADAEEIIRVSEKACSGEARTDKE